MSQVRYLRIFTIISFARLYVIDHVLMLACTSEFVVFSNFPVSLTDGYKPNNWCIKTTRNNMYLPARCWIGILICGQSSPIHWKIPSVTLLINHLSGKISLSSVLLSQLPLLLHTFWRAHPKKIVAQPSTELRWLVNTHTLLCKADAYRRMFRTTPAIIISANGAVVIKCSVLRALAATAVIASRIY